MAESSLTKNVMNLFKRTVKNVAHQSWGYIADSFTNFQSDRIDGTPFFYASMPSLYTRQDGQDTTFCLKYGHR